MNRPELVIGLVAPVGCNRELAKESIESFLNSCGYQHHTVRLSSVMQAFRNHKLDENQNEKIRIDQLMETGNDLRNKHGGDILGKLAIHEIRNFREKKGNEPQKPLYDTAYIIDSLKHPKEIELLKNVYKDHFLCISIYEPVEQRTRNLQRIMQKSIGFEIPGDLHKDAIELVNRDEKEPEKKYGQSVRDAFPLSDFFVNGTRGEDLRAQIRRFFELLFGNAFITPTIDEYGMFQAQTAALRSADLSRQVGVSILNNFGELIVTGCNEVPIHGGGSFWSKSSGSKNIDNRDFVLGYDSSVAIKNDLLIETIEALGEEWINSNKFNMGRKDILNELLYGDKALLKSKRINSILEFGRVVHAEMHAIGEAARRGIPIRNSILYTTTFPCHMCARHIIASGISKVIFVEPYPKSLAKQLHPESISIDGDIDSSPNALKFETFVGIAPRKYFDFFTNGKRKDDAGRAIEWSAANAVPKISSTIGYIINESEQVASLETLFPKSRG